MPCSPSTIPMLAFSGAFALVAAIQAEAAKAQTIFSPHYRMWTSAPVPRAKLALEATEALHERWHSWVGDLGAPDTIHHKLRMYASRREMRQDIPGMGWAEAFYNGEECLQYDDPSAEHPFQWLIHEATHQLAAEDTHLKLPRWANEGVAELFGVSRILPDSRKRMELRLGSMYPNTYPLWWLPRFKLSGNMASDLREGKIVLATTILQEPENVDISNSLNQHYLAWLCMAHLFHSTDSSAWRKWVLTDGTDEGLMKVFGPRSTLDARWYAHMMKLSDSANAKK